MQNLKKSKILKLCQFRKKSSKFEFSSRLDLQNYKNIEVIPFCKNRQSMNFHQGYRLAKFQKYPSCSNFPKSIKISIFIKAIDLQNLKKYKILRLFQFCKNRQNISFYQGKDNMSLIKAIRAGTRAVDSGGRKPKIKHKSHCPQKSKLVDWEGQACRLGGLVSLGVGPEGCI